MIKELDKNLKLYLILRKNLIFNKVQVRTQTFFHNKIQIFLTFIEIDGQILYKTLNYVTMNKKLTQSVFFLLKHPGAARLGHLLLQHYTPKCRWIIDRTNCESFELHSEIEIKRKRFWAADGAVSHAVQMQPADGARIWDGTDPGTLNGKLNVWMESG